MDRKELLRLAAADLNRRDKDDMFPAWLRSAEFRLNNLLRDRKMVKRAILPVTETTFPGPPDFLEIDSMSIQAGTASPIEPGSKIGTMIYVPPSDADAGGKEFVTNYPRHYTIRGQFFELVGWNVADPFQVQLFYYAKLPVLDQDNRTNWLLDEAPHIYINAILHFGFLHLEEFDTAQNYLQMVAAECQAMNDRSQAMKHGSGPLVRRPARKIGGRHS